MIPLLLLAIENQDDRDFMENVYLTYQRLLYSQAYNLLKDPWATEDVLQTTFIKLMRGNIEKLRSFDRKELVRYILKAVQNEVYTWQAKKNKVVLFSFDEAMDNVDNDDTDMIDMDLFFGYDVRLQQIEDESELMSSWNAISERSRLILDMKYQLECSNEEIAKVLNVSPASIRTLLCRARNELKDQLDKRKHIV